MFGLKELLRDFPNLKLAVAESVTCGRLQARIGTVPGASTFFLGGITCYALDQKVRHLGVDREAAQRVNSVSQEVAEQMAQGACRLFGATIALGITGYAEPAPELQIAYPRAFWALAHDLGDGRMAIQGSFVECPGASRVTAQDTMAAVALGGLMQYLVALKARASEPGA